MRVRRAALTVGDDCRALAAEIRAPGTSASRDEVEESVRSILASVEREGDEAVRSFNRRFDGHEEPTELRVSRAEIDEAGAELDPAVRRGLEVAIANVRAVAEAELAAERPSFDVTLPEGQEVRVRGLAVERTGVYVPGGRAAYPSSVVMCCIPAQVAGVHEIAAVSPPADGGKPHPIVLAACALCGIEELYAIGGAQAIAALTYGTATVGPVGMIVGPGNSYVQEAKRQLFGAIGIDALAGPSELVVIADQSADAERIALDLAAQAEHGPDSIVVLISQSEELLAEVERLTGEIAARAHGVSDASLFLIRASKLELAVALTNAIAPEHVELQCEDTQSLADSITAAGCVFVGANAATAFGDYVAGSNHVLPTGGAARFAGPLGVSTFRRRQALVSLPDEAAAALAPYVGSIARAESFPIHAESAEARAER